MKKQSFVHGALILIVANIVVKVFGAIFKVPLTNIIGIDAMAYFNAAYSLYVVFYMVSTAGLPVAISKMVASADTKKDEAGVNHIFSVSFYLFLVIGLIGTVTMILFSKQYSVFVQMPALYYAIIAISPTLFFICITSSYRGYFQGLRNMTPTAVSQIIEAIGKLFIGLIVGWLAVQAEIEKPKVAALVILGVTIGVVANTLYLYIVKLTDKRKSAKKAAGRKISAAEVKKILRSLISIAIPITISASIMSLIGLFDTMLIVKRLVSIDFAEDIARKIYGAYTSMCVPLFNMPPTLIYPFAISIIPVLAETFLTKDHTLARTIKNSTLRLASIISVPCSLGMAVLSKEIISVLYTQNELLYKNSAGEYIYAFDVAGPLLSILALCIFFVGMLSVTNAMLQAYEQEWKTILSSAAGIVCKLVLAYLLLGNQSIGIYGAPLSTAAAYLVMMALNFYFLARHTGYIPSVRKVFVKPLLAGIGCSLTAMGIHFLTAGINLSATVSLFLSILAAVIVYLILLYVFKGIEREDIVLLPKGEKICAALDKINFFK